MGGMKRGPGREDYGGNERARGQDRGEPKAGSPPGAHTYQEERKQRDEHQDEASAAAVDHLGRVGAGPLFRAHDFVEPHRLAEPRLDIMIVAVHPVEAHGM